MDDSERLRLVRHSFEIRCKDIKQLKNAHLALQAYEMLLEREPNTVIAGGFAAFLLDLKASYNDIDIFLPYSEQAFSLVVSQLLPKLRQLDSTISYKIFRNPDEYNTFMVVQIQKGDSAVLDIVFVKDRDPMDRESYIRELVSQFDLNFSRCVIDCFSSLDSNNVLMIILYFGGPIELGLKELQDKQQMIKTVLQDWKDISQNEERMLRRQLKRIEKYTPTPEVLENMMWIPKSLHVQLYDSDFPRLSFLLAWYRLRSKTICHNIDSFIRSLYNSFVVLYD